MEIKMYNHFLIRRLGNIKKIIPPLKRMAIDVSISDDIDIATS